MNELLSAADEYPIHQTPEPIAVSGSDNNFYDRFWFNAYSRDGRSLFAMAMGLYPNLNVHDAAACIVHNDRQQSLFASRLLGLDRLNLTVKPMSVSVDKPLEQISIRIDSNEYGIEGELVLTGRASPIQEPRFTWRLGTRTIMDLTRMSQSCVINGWLKMDGERIEVDGWWGTRDRSWGVRSVGGANQSPFPPEMDPQFFWIWCPFNGDNHLMYWHTNDDATGKPWNRSSLLVPLHGGAPVEVEMPRAELKFRSGTRHLEYARLTGETPNGPVAMELFPEWNFYMKSVGYGHPEWGHSAYQGEYATHFEQSINSEIDETEWHNNHVQACSRAVLHLPDGTQENGRAMLEQLFIGESRPYGLKSLFDMAP
jgi:hypothetical protein